jgi:hypothetical protein
VKEVLQENPATMKAREKIVTHYQVDLTGGSDQVYLSVLPDSEWSYKYLDNVCYSKTFKEFEL